MVESSSNPETWEKDGQKRRSYYCLVEEWEFCGSKKISGSSKEAPVGEEDDFPF